MTNDTSKNAAVYESRIYLSGSLPILQVLKEKGPLKNKELMDEGICENAAALSYRLKGLHQTGLIKINSENIVGGRPVYSISEYGEEIIPIAEKLEKIIQKARSKIKK